MAYRDSNKEDGIFLKCIKDLANLPDFFKALNLIKKQVYICKGEFYWFKAHVKLRLLGQKASRYKISIRKFKKAFTQFNFFTLY